MSKIFIDTNLLVYAVDRHDPEKQKRSRSLLQDLAKNGNGVLSTQVLQELYVVSTVKLKIAPLEAKNILRSLENFETVVVDLPLIKDAVDTSILNQISFWDALIVIAAQSAKCGKVWTEDLRHGQTFHGVLIENPLL